MSAPHGPTLRVFTWPKREALYRIHLADQNALWFGPGAGAPARSRFDSPLGEYQTCYLGASPAAAFVETMLRGQRIRLIARATLRARAISRIRVHRPLHLAQLDGAGLVALGMGGDTVHGAAYEASRQLARAAFHYARQIDGIRYRSRWDDDCYCLALFDRAADAVTAEDPKRLGQDGAVLALLDRYDVGIA